MSVQIVKHGSREFDIVLNFASTENNLSWSFTQEGDGEIFDVVKTNVASYTVSGSAIALPYSVTNGSSYSVSIVKTTTGQTASITFKTRRSNNKTVTLSVPDFGQYDGRYTYAIHGNNTIDIFDMSLFTTSNYIGAGSFTISPKIITKTLPTLPTGAIWNLAEFVVRDGVQYFFVIGSKDDAFTIYSCNVRVSDGQITNEIGTIDAYTLISPASSLRYGIVQNCVYDYINNILYYSNISGFNGSNSFYYNLTSKVFVNRLGASLSTQIGFRNGIKFYFDPNSQKIISSNAEFKFNPTNICPYIYNPSTASYFNIYRSLNGYRYRDQYQNETYNTFQIYNSNGEYIGQIGASSYLGRIISAQLLEPYIFQYELNNGKLIAIFNLSTNTGVSYTFSSDFPTNSVSFIDACVSMYNGERHFLVATKENTSGTFSRLFRVYENGGVFSYIYYDLLGVCQDIGNNRLLN